MFFIDLLVGLGIGAVIGSGAKIFMDGGKIYSNKSTFEKKQKRYSCNKNIYRNISDDTYHNMLNKKEDK